MTSTSSRGNVPSSRSPPTAKRLSQKTLKAKETRWDKRIARLAACATGAFVIALWALSAYALDRPPRGRGPQGDTVIGYALGILTVVLYGVVAVYSLRHRRRIQKHAMTRTWMEVHLAFGIVAGLSAVLHSGPRLLSAAPLHGAFLAAWLCLIASGILGKLIGVVVPRRLTRIEDEALLVEDVSERKVAMRREIEELLQANPEEVVVHYANEVVPPAIKDPQTYGKRRLRRFEIVEEIWAQTEGMRLLPPEKHETGKRLVTCLVEERFLERMERYHWLLRAWVPIHVALTTICFPWLLIHMVTVYIL
jgi:hypothetical protein